MVSWLHDKHHRQRRALTAVGAEYMLPPPCQRQSLADLGLQTPGHHLCAHMGASPHMPPPPRGSPGLHTPVSAHLATGRVSVRMGKARSLQACGYQKTSGGQESRGCCPSPRKDLPASHCPTPGLVESELGGLSPQSHQGRPCPRMPPSLPTASMTPGLQGGSSPGKESSTFWGLGPPFKGGVQVPVASVGGNGGHRPDAPAS